MYSANEIMFPAYVIPDLRDSRGSVWNALIDRVTSLPETHEEVLAFMLMMIRLNGCMECETDSYRAMRGCGACALQMLRRYKAPDEDLLAAYEVALRDIRKFIEQGTRENNSRLENLLKSY
ncbi:MAG TPA: hypothetical protein VJZ27_11920 [Aggregatilineales bacterium]|nr:hypothetical protein [Aggregatilineales bacterium]